MKKNTFSKALRHLKSTELDEKIQRLNEAPTNSIGGVYALNPSGFRYGEKDPERVFYADVDGNWPEGVPGVDGELSYTRPAGYWDYGPGTIPAVQTTTPRDWSLDTVGEDGNSTNTMIRDSDGLVLADLPAGTRNFILGPLVDGYVLNHGSVYNDDYTNIGYIQKDTRQFILLGRIQGAWTSAQKITVGGYTSRVWNGESSQFTSYNPNFTLEHALWFRDQMISGNYGDAAYKYSGGVPQQPHPDDPEFKRGNGAGNGGNGGKGGAGGSGDDEGEDQDDPRKGGPKDAGYPWGPEDFDDKPVPPDIYGDLILLGLSAALAKALIAAFGAAGAAAVVRSADQLRRFLEWYNKGRNTRFPDENNARMRDLFRDDWMQRGKPGDGTQGGWDPIWSFTRGLNTGPTPFNRQVIERPIRQIMKLFDSYEIIGEIISEEKKEIPSEFIDLLDDAFEEMGRGEENIKKLISVLDKFIKQTKNNKKESVKESKEVLTESRKRILREIKQPYKLPEEPKQKYKMNFKGKFSPQNTPDVTASKKTDEEVKAQNAAGQTWRTKDKYWSRYQSQERINVIYDQVGHGNQYWEMIVNENQNNKGIRDRQIQEYLNIIAHEKAMLQENSNYVSPFSQKIQEQETLQADSDPLFKKVSKRLKKEIDYPNKPSKAGYPNNPPPEMVNGFHPEYGNKGNYYDKLDPQSAEAMPPTGNPEIDTKVQKAKRLKKILGKKG